MLSIFEKYPHKNPVGIVLNTFKKYPSGNPASTWWVFFKFDLWVLSQFTHQGTHHEPEPLVEGSFVM